MEDFKHYRDYNKAIANLMVWPFEDKFENPYTTDDLMMVLLKLGTIGWEWKIYANTAHLNEVAIRLKHKDKKTAYGKLYVYSRDIKFALYGAVGQALTSPLNQ